MEDIKDKLLKSYQNNFEKAKLMEPKHAVGNRVRVLKLLTDNVIEVNEYLGSICTVEKVNIHVPIFSDSPKIEYLLRLGKRLEPFWEDELDSRFKVKNFKK